MNSNWAADGLVTAQSQNIDKYRRNFLRQVVCEFRFPTLMELGEAKPPAPLVTALRKEYPHLEMGNEVTFGIAGSATGSHHVHTMRSAKLNWSVSIKQSSLTIETTAYVEFAQMRQRILRVVEAAAKVIDSDFFTRIGLRYINVIDSGTDPADGWVNPLLVGPIRQGAFKGIQEFAGKMLLSAEDGGCLLQHGIRIKAPIKGEAASPEYFIDIDSFRNEVQIDQVEAAIGAIHSQAFNLFDWCIGPSAREYLLSETPKK